METEHASYRLGLTERRSRWLINWLRLRDKVEAGHVTATEMAQGLGRLGFAAISLDWECSLLGKKDPTPADLEQNGNYAGTDCTGTNCSSSPQSTPVFRTRPQFPGLPP